MTVVDLAAELVPTAQSPVDRAYHYISGLIDLKIVAHGELLPKADVLAKRIGVNRDAVLDAFRQLQAHGLVRVGLGRAGVRVAEQVGASRDARIAWVWEHRETIAEMATLRSILEPGVIRLVAERGLSRRVLASARREHTRLVDGLPSQQRQAADAEFHRLLMSGIEAKTIERLSLLVRRWVVPAFDLIAWPPNRTEQNHAEHQALLEAIEARDPGTAEDLMHRHVAASTHLIHDFLASLDTPRDTPTTAEANRLARHRQP